jgi:exo-beta-1,3-glucanase (GH17 family)
MYFFVGSELVNSEQYKDQWIKTIQAVRAIYKGQLTYSSNWDAYWKVPFWDHLDLISMNSYWDMTKKPPETSVDTFKTTWSGIQKDLFAFLHKVNKPVMFSEVGWCSLGNAATASWDYTQTQLPADNDLQKRLYQAFFESWWGKPELAGFSVWEFDPGGDETGKGYTPVGKPAEKVMQEWFAKPRWEVQAAQ